MVWKNSRICQISFPTPLSSSENRVLEGLQSEQKQVEEEKTPTLNPKLLGRNAGLAYSLELTLKLNP